MEDIKFSPKSDIAVNKLNDVIPERMIKVYPYEMPNASSSQEFIGEQTTSIVQITQINLDINNHNLKQDEHGNGIYFEAFPSISIDEVLDESTSTSTLGKNLENEPSFTILSNWNYEKVLEKFQVWHTNFEPYMFTIGVPYNDFDYRNGKQMVYFSSGINESKENYDNIGTLDNQGLYEFQLLNISSLESQFTNAKIMFTTIDINGDDILTTDGNKSGIVLGFENHTLINFVKGKGKIEEFDNGIDEGTEFGEIDFVSNKPLAPFKMTPINTDDKVTMYADWFDYDVVLPFALIEKFKVAANLKTVIGTNEDRHMVEDMILISAGFAKSWEDAPRVGGNGSNSDKIDPTYKLGNSNISIVAIADQDPVKVVDGIFETHIRTYPNFLDDESRYQPVKGILCALSRYLYTSYAIGKGQNSFNAIYLPWYLEPSTIIGNTIDDNTKFRAKTNYFRTKHTDPIDLKATNELILPPNVNLSNVKIMQTDRKLTLPEITSIVYPINKLPLPGDISTESSDDLQFIWYLPIQATTNANGDNITSQQAMEEFFLDELVTKSSIAKGQDITLYPSQFVNGNGGIGIDGKIWTQTEINAQVLNVAKGNIKQAPTITQIDSSQITKSPSEIGYRDGIKQSNTIGQVSNANVIIRIANAFNYEDTSSIKIISNTIKSENIGGSTNGFNIEYSGHVIYTVSHSEFGNAIVTSSGSVQSTYSYEQRQVLFDKQSWKQFLTRFNFIPNSTVDYELLEKEEFRIKKLNEIIIGSMWGNYVQLKVNRKLIATIKLFNSTDETIGIQRIIFT